jgi:putative two-component system response regulator
MPLNRKKVVLVDDNPVNLKLARNTLMGQYDVFTIPSADKLFQLLNRIVPDLILLDVLMPRMNGYEVINALKAEPRTANIPVIFLTAKADAISELEGFTLGAVDYISKPFSPQLLLKRVEVHLLLESQRRELEQLDRNLYHRGDEQTGAALELQNAVIVSLSSLVSYRNDIGGERIQRMERLLRVLTGEMRRQGLYRDVLETWNLELFFQSARLHDVGKIAVHDEILLKPGALSPDEFGEVKKHPLFGETVIEGIQGLARDNMFLTHAKIMAGAHHEKWDGTGYPRGIGGADIPLQGRLMALVDVYDALLSDRPYKKALPPEQAVEIIKEGRGTYFEPSLGDVFISAFKDLR